MRRKKPTILPNIQETLQNLPTEPGVYLMKGAEGEILYVGKAKRLRNRVRSYFSKSGLPSLRIATMVTFIRAIDYIVTASELEALILEATLIKKHKPPYNVVLKDDKSFPYIKLTINEAYPRVTTVRKIRKDGALYFGPYVYGGAMQKTLKLIKRLFPLRHCALDIADDGTRRERPCFEYEIHRCLAPCAGKCSKEEYWQVVEEVKLFLQGKKDDLLMDLQARMEEKAERLEFEAAGRLRDQMLAVKQVMERQNVISTKFENQDVIASARKGPQVSVQIFFIRNGIMMGRKAFQFSEQVQGEDERVEHLEEREILRSFIQQFYLKDVLIPEEILLPEPISNQAMIAEWLTEKRGKKVRFLIPQRGRKRRLLELAQQNAAMTLQAIEEQDGEQFRPILEALQTQFQLRTLPQRIECFDISNIQGNMAVGSMVVCEQGLMQPKEYRRFKIKTVDGSDDFAMMHEVITRRYSRLQREDRAFPDLVIVDGGKGQLHAAREALKTLEIEALDVLGLAKAHGPRGSEKDLERIFTDITGNGIRLDTSTKSAQLLQRIRDEAHRFAITYHRTLRKKANFHSILEEIPGVGQKRRKRLLTRFGSLKKLKAASSAEIASTPSINQELAETIHAFLHAQEEES